MTSKATRKRAAADDYDEGDGFVAGDGSDDQTAPKASKKIKATKSTGRNAAKAGSEEAAQFWELSDKRRVSVEDFRGKTLISVREFYEKDGELLPGKKVGLEGLSSSSPSHPSIVCSPWSQGISLSMPQYTALISHLPEIESALSARGESVDRPRYNGDNGRRAQSSPEKKRDDESNEDGNAVSEGKDRKNYEATSESDS